MGKGNKQNFARKRKRKGHGNQYTKQHCKYKKACAVEVVILVILCLAQVQRKRNYKKIYRAMSKAFIYLFIYFQFVYR